MGFALNCIRWNCNEQDVQMIIGTQNTKNQQVVVEKTPEQEKKWDVARKFEAMFVNEIFKSMRKTVMHDPENEPSQGRKIFTEMLDREYSQLLTKGHSSTGLAEVLYKQMDGDQKAPEFDNSAALNMAHSLGGVSKQVKVAPAKEAISTIVSEAASKFGVDKNLIESIIKNESSGNQYAVSPVGAKGLMQLMDSTAKELGVTNPFDARENIMGGTKYIKQMLSKFNNSEPLALAAYNAGPSNVEKYGGIPPFQETQKYVIKVLKDKEALASE